MSTRKLIIAAMLTGMAILVAGTILLLSVPKSADLPPTLPYHVQPPAAATTAP